MDDREVAWAAKLEELRVGAVSHRVAWQAWGNVHCQGGRMYALASLRRPSGVPWSPPLLRGRRGAICTARGSNVRPGVPPASLQCPLVSAAFVWQAWDNVHCQGVGCTPWRPSGVPPVSLGPRRFCVAGVGQCALPRGRMYALASLRRPSGVPPVSLGLRRFCVACAWCCKTQCHGCMKVLHSCGCARNILLCFAAGHRKSYSNGCSKVPIVICHQVFSILALVIFVLRFLLQSASESFFLGCGTKIRAWTCNFRRHCA